MSCECSINNSIFLYDLLNTNIEKIQFNYDLADYIEDYSPSTSGIWLPVLFNEPPNGSDNKNWTRVTKGRTFDTPIEECTDIETPKGLGLEDFITLDNPDLNSWVITGDCRLKIDWIINFQKCKEYHNCILFWYRYYDVSRSNDLRLIPGVDIYISDGDFAFIEDSPEVTDNLLPIANRIYNELIDVGYTDSDAELKAKVLASGPQIDKITDSLYKDPNALYINRDSYGRISDILYGMSIKTYSDIGKNNFITTKYDLMSKLVAKYGALLEIPENSRTKLISKFWSETGPNLQINIDGDLYRSDPEQYSGYNISIKAGDLTLSASRSNETFIPSKYDSISEEIVSANEHSINYFRLNNKVLNYNLIDNVSGIFNPDLSVINFHGFGGVDFETTSLFGNSCVDGVSLYTDENDVRKAKYANSQVINGPFFTTDLYNPSSTGIEKTRCRVEIDIETSTNAKFVFNDKITTSYLRSETKPNCPSFVLNQNTCKCYSLSRLHPKASGQNTSNKDDIVYTPDTSLFYLPSGQFYGGLTTEQVATYGVSLPNHPVPGTSLPKIHNKFFPLEDNCTLSMDGCGSKTFTFYMPYPGKAVLSYQSPRGYFSISDGTVSATSPRGTDDTIFTGTAGTICIDKKLATPSGVSVYIGVPSDQPETQWGITISGIQNNYVEQIPFGDGLVLSGRKGFFHPNFGLTYDARYHNKSPVIPNHRNVIQKKLKNIQENFTITLRYDEEYAGSGPDCAGGHVCNRAKFDVYANDTFIGTANLNNAGGSEDPGPAGTYSRKNTFNVPSSIGLINGNQINLYIKCAYKDGCHGGVARVDIFNSKGQAIYQGCLQTDIVVPVTLDFSVLPIYNYNAYRMYNNDYLPGYNYIFDISALADGVKQNFTNSDYIGIKTLGNSFYVTKQYSKIKYVPSESLILESVPFEYINFDALYGYAINDFHYKKLSANSIAITSQIEGSGRALAYIDSPLYNSEQEFKIYSNKTLEDTTITVTSNDKNIVVTNENIQSPEFDNGFIFRSQDNQSVVVYSPNYTFNDHITTGKWGNHSYSEAIYEFYKYLDPDKELNINNLNYFYNNSFLRERFSSNTSFSWGAPIAFYNNYDTDNITRYFPVSRLFNSYKNSQREMHVVGFKNIYNTAMPDGDRIIASGTLAGSYDYIYLGPYIGDLQIKVKVAPVSKNTIGTIRLSHNGTQLDEQLLANHSNGIFTFNITKDEELSRYGSVVIDFSSAKCADPTLLAESPSKLQTYSITINNSSEELRQKSRISYFSHKHTPLLNKQPSFANNFPSQNINTDDGQKIAPLYPNQQFVDNQRVDYSPYLDLHIFSNNETDRPIISSSGLLFFEDFLQPKSYRYLQNMEVPYNPDIYWIDLPAYSDWSILTSKGILLEPNKIYKILKSLKYNCQADANKCAGRYPSNICDFSYDLSEGELFDLLGLSGDDKAFIDLQTIKFPNYCEAIDFCCDKLENINQRNDCLNRQTQARNNCKNYWNNTAKKNVTCISEPCPTGNFSGTINSTAEYFMLTVKNNLAPDLSNISQSNFHFFRGDDTASIPCTNETFASIGNPYKYSYSCVQLDSKCDSIIPKDFDISSEYLPGKLLDLSSIVRGQEYNLNPSPSSVIIDNELKYRSVYDHPNKISLPFEEYDPIAESKYLISYQFKIKSKKCTNGELFNLKIDSDIDCTFWAQPTSSGTILISTCFPDQRLKGNPTTDYQLTVNKTICDEKHACKADYCYVGDDDCYYPSLGCEHEDWSCEKAEDYLKSVYGEKATLVSCEETSNPEDYYLDCRLCDKTLTNEDGDPCTTNYYGITLNYKTPVEQQCFCPEWATLNAETKQCEYQYTVLVCNDNCKEGTEQTVTGYLQASCAQPGFEPTEAQIQAYDEACGIENIRTSKEYSVVWTEESDGRAKSHELGLSYAKEFNRINVASCQLQTESNACYNSCYNTYNKCIQGGGNWIACGKAYSACTCSCQKSFNEAQAALEISRQFYYFCTDNCGWSDSITHNYYDGFYWYYNNCYGYYWWYWNSAGTCTQNPLYYKPNSSYNEYIYSTGYKRDCDYSACKNAKERISMNRYISNTSCQCVTDYYGYTGLQCDGECHETNYSDLGQVTTQYKSHVVEYDIITKTKRPPVTKFEDRESKYSNVKVYSKSFDLRWRYQPEDNGKGPTCDPPCKDNKICCESDSSNNIGICKEDCCVDKVDLDFTVTFDIYHNMIVGTLSGNSTKLCKPRNPNINNFKCPVVSYTIANQDVSICDTVSSDCYSCYLGGVPS